MSSSSPNVTSISASSNRSVDQRCWMSMEGRWRSFARVRFKFTRSLFVLQSKINHACAPNAKLVCAFTDATIDIVAERDLRRGDEICISYIGPGLGRVRRRQLLRANYGFGCVCSLCSSEATTTDVATA